MSAPGRIVTIVLNGAPREVPERLTAAGLLEVLGLGRARVAVEVNGRVVRGAELSGCVLGDRDRVEVVQFVGGG